MLDGINKISADIDPRKGRSTDYIRVIKDGQGQSHYHPKKGDAAILSPLAKHLRETGWEVKYIEYPSPEKLYLIFLISAFEFQTILDFTLIPHTARLDYNVVHDGEYNGKKLRSLAQFSYRKDNVEITAMEKQPSIKPLATLFDNIFALDITHEMKRQDSEMTFLSLQEGIEEDLDKIFRTITGQLFYIIEKTGALRLEKIKFPGDDETPLLLERLISVNTAKSG